MCKIVKQRKKFFFLKKGKNLLTPNGKFLYAKSLKHANLLLNELKNKYKNNDQFSVLNLTFFSCNLSTSDKEKIKKSVLDLIYDDYVLYRRFSEKEIRKKMESSFDKFILCFSKKFKINLSLMSTISCKQKDLNLVLFLKFLDKLNIFELVVFYKLSKLTGSVILSFFFIKEEINDLYLFELCNIENNFQQKIWGKTSEQNKVDKYFLDSLKNISIFVKNVG